MVDCYRLFHDRAFRKQKRGNPRRSPVNRALFEVWAASLESLSPSDVQRLGGKRSDLRERFLVLAGGRRFRRSDYLWNWRSQKGSAAVFKSRRDHSGDSPMIQSIQLTNFKCFEQQDVLLGRSLCSLASTVRENRQLSKLFSCSGNRFSKISCPIRGSHT